MDGSASSPTATPRPRHQGGSSPSAPSNATPTALGGRTASGPAPTGAAPITGVLAPTTRPHGPTTRSLLQIQWDYPVYSGGVATLTDGKPQSARKGPLPLSEALRFIARDDPRPLLVVRECPKCNRTDRALLTPGVDNEKTILYSRWFHCVKLAPDVSQPEHALHALFPRDDAEHLFVSAADGSHRVPLEASTSRTVLWAAMSSTLAQAYAVDPSPACKQLASLVEGFDLADQKLIDLREKRSRVLETERFDPSELRKLDDEIGRLQKQLASDLERAQGLSQASRPAGG